MTLTPPPAPPPPALPNSWPSAPPRTPPGPGSPPLRGPGPRTPWTEGVRSRVVGTEEGRRTSESGEVPAGVIAPGVVTPRGIPKEDAMVSTLQSGPSSPRQPGRGWGPEPGERILAPSSFRAGDLGRTWERVGLAAAGSGRPGGGRCRRGEGWGVGGTAEKAFSVFG